jgi:hypothetical protein
VEFHHLARLRRFTVGLEFAVHGLGNTQYPREISGVIPTDLGSNPREHILYQLALRRHARRIGRIIEIVFTLAVRLDVEPFLGETIGPVAQLFVQRGAGAGILDLVGLGESPVQVETISAIHHDAGLGNAPCRTALIQGLDIGFIVDVRPQAAYGAYLPLAIVLRALSRADAKEDIRERRFALGHEVAEVREIIVTLVIGQLDNAAANFLSGGAINFDGAGEDEIVGFKQCCDELIHWVNPFGTDSVR